MNILDKIYEARARERERRETWENEQETARKAREVEYQRACQVLLGKTVRGTEADYALWLKQFLEDGGAITHWYDDPMRTDDLRLLRVGTRAEMVPLFGAAAISIIVQRDAELVLEGDYIGHNQVYFMRGHPRSQLGGFVPCYPDVLRILEDGR